MEKKIKEAVSFLSKVFEGDYKSLAKIVVAESESDIDTIINCLDEVEKNISKLKNELRNIEE